MWQSSPERPEPGSSAPPSGEARWAPWTAPVALVCAYMAALVGGIVIAVVATAFGAQFASGDTPPGVILGATFVQDAGFVAAAVIFARMSGPVWAAQFGLRATRVWRAIGWMVLLYGGFMVFTAIWSQLVGMDEAKDQLDDLGVEDSDAAMVFGALLVVVVAPVVEELFFRGFFFRALRNWKGLWPAALITGAVFGAIHLGSADLKAILPLAVLGLALCLLYAQTDSLYPPIAVHAINNSVAFGSAVGWSWQIPLLLVGSLAACGTVTVLASRRFPAPAAAG